MTKSALVIDDAWWDGDNNYPIVITKEEDDFGDNTTVIDLLGTGYSILLPLEEIEQIVNFLGYTLVEKENIKNE